MRRWISPAMGLVCIIDPIPGAGAAPLTDRVQFNRDIRPILSDKCFACHGPDQTKRKAGLRLDVREAALARLKSGAAAVVAGKPEASELVARVFSAEASERMPPITSHKTLSQREKQLLKDWIAQGANYQPHWSIIAPVSQTPPVVRDQGWPRNPIDHFVLARLEREGVAPSPPADKITLLRRVTLDLTGLPPTPAEVDAFVADAAPGAYERVVDRLLASPRYGERMAVDWLDAARYADSNGYQVDRDREMWPWRDWVVNAFNRNLPFDRFTIEQLAGDMLPNATREQRVATGLHRNHMLNEEGGIIPEEFLAEYVADRVETTATIWLGLTVGCARCHDHKFDPLTQRDYYGLFAFFHNVPEKGVGNFGGPPKQSAPPLLALTTPEQEKKLGELTAGIRKLEQELAAATRELNTAQAAWEKSLAEQKSPQLPPNIAKILAVAATKRTDKQKSELESHYRRNVSTLGKRLYEPLARMRKEKVELEAKVPTLMVMAETPQPRETFLLIRGQYDKKGEKVGPATPSVLPALSTALPRNRLGLARWLVDPGNPLTARVTVNRYWQALFGVGLVRTAEDFGSQGEAPSHPELLDWLATEFVRIGWDIKAMHRFLVTSATYRQSSRTSPRQQERDPENRLLGRGPRFRMGAEMIRDQALAASGLLVQTVGGPPVKPYHPAGLYELVVYQGGVPYQQSKGADLYRRSLYTYWKRSVPHPAMLALGAPFREVCTVRRPRTTTPLQALNLLNDPTYVEASRFLAQRMMLEGGSPPEQRIAHGFRLVVARPPRPQETAILAAGFRRMLGDFRADGKAASELLRVGEMPVNTALDGAELAAYTMVASTLLNLDETVTKE